MSRLYCLLLALVLGAAAGAQSTAPGGQFEARLKAAERKARKPAKPVRRTPRRAVAAPRRPVRAVSRPAPKPKRVVRTAPRRPRRRPRVARVPAPVSRGWVSYSVDPRADRPTAPLLTGDLVLFAQPQGVPVRFTWDGGQRVTRSTLVLKGQLPRNIRVTADASSLRGSATAWVPVKAGCITTVRFGFARRGQFASNR